ncbi:MAG: type II toxin-antitoxin system RelB/DinJ family antitoxin [Lachnospiraceae bacterium]|jgi:DNA-damage-inducible protein J|nr:type II toxin-antitoxin system RelB/DinJ family antitoxin [Lachnospiraceae bacterium]
MATKKAVFNMRVEEDKKNNVEQLYKNLGMTLPQAVNMFFTQSLLVGGLPFEAKMPRYNKETEEAMQEARDITAGRVQAKSYSSARELFEELDAE